MKNLKLNFILLSFFITVPLCFRFIDNALKMIILMKEIADFTEIYKIITTYELRTENHRIIRYFNQFILENYNLNHVIGGYSKRTG